MALLGNAALTWTDPTDTTGTERVHLLAVPLREVTPGYAQTSYWSQSLDKTVTQVYNLGNGAHELVGHVHYDREHQSLLDLMRAGALNATLNYYPNLNDPGVVYAVKLISPVTLDALTAQLDAQRGQLGDLMAELRFRQTNQAAFSPLYTGSPVLFRYVAGESLSTATFTRAGTATYASKGPGTLTTAASGAARIEWWDLDGDGIRETPTLLLEGASTNLVIYSTTFGSWTAVNTPTITTGQADPAGGTSASLIADTDAVNQSAVTITPTFTGNAVKSVSLWVKQGTSLAAAGSDIQLTDTSASADRLLATVTWSNGTPSVAMTTGTFIGSSRWVNGWFRLKFQTTSVTAANTNVLKVIPAHTANQTGNIYAYGVQAEDSLVATSYIPTSGSTVARVRDALTWPVAYRAQTLTLYLRYVALGSLTGVATGRVPVAIGTSSTLSQFRIAATSSGVTATAQTQGTGGSAVTPAFTNGQVVEYVATFRVTGTTATAQLQAAVNGVLGAAGSVSSASQVYDTFTGALLGLNGTPSSSSADCFATYTHVVIARGVQPYDACRRLAGLAL